MLDFTHYLIFNRDEKTKVMLQYYRKCKLLDLCNKYGTGHFTFAVNLCKLLNFQVKLNITSLTTDFMWKR